MSLFSGLKLPGIKIGNASDEDILIVFDSVEKFFPAGEVVELEGHNDFPRTAGGAILKMESTGLDAYGRPVPTTADPIPKVGASSVDIAGFCLERGASLGLYHFTGNQATDAVVAKQARAIGIKTRATNAEKIMAEWRQTCRLANATGSLIPPMPEHVAKADLFLVNNAKVAKEAVKRFQIKLDGASYDTIEEAKEHIFKRPHYVEHRENWKTQVVDRFGDDVVVEPEPEEDKPKPKGKK